MPARAFEPLHAAIASLIATGAPVPVLQTLASAGMAAPSSVAAALTTQLAIATDLVVEGAAVASTPDVLKITGRSRVLGVASMEIEVSLTASATTCPDVRMVMRPPAGWRLSDSFSVFGSPALNPLVLSQPAFVFSVTDGKAADGLRFDAGLQPAGLAALLAGVLEGGAPDAGLQLAGTIDRAPRARGAPSPAVALRADLGRPLLSVPGFELEPPYLSVSNDPNAVDGPQAVPRLLLCVPVKVQGRRILEIESPIRPASSGLVLTISGLDGGVSIEEIASLVAGHDVRHELPSFLEPAFRQIAFKGFALELAGAKPDKKHGKPQGAPLSLVPSMIALSVGSKGKWNLGDVSVDETTLTFHAWFDPDGSVRTFRTFHADVTIFPEVFHGFFELDVDDRDGRLEVSAEYHGDVSLNALVAGLSNNTVAIPADVAEVTFSDFGIDFAKEGTGWSWRLFGKSDAAFALPIVSAKTHASLFVDVGSNGTARTYRVVGLVEIGSVHFSVEVDLGHTSNLLRATWAMSPGTSLGLKDLAAALGLPDPQIPEGLDLALEAASFDYDFNTRSLALSAESANYGQALFVALSKTKTPLYAFGVNVPLHLRLADLPLVGGRIPDGENLGIDQATIWLLSREASKEEVELLNARAANTHFPALPDKDIRAAAILGAHLTAGDGDPVPLQVEIGARQKRATLAARVDGEAPGGSTTWIDLQKQIGPLTFGRIGIGYEKGKLRFALDAGIVFGPLDLSMDGLSVAMPLTQPKDKPAEPPVFDLAGLGLAFNRPPIEIAGSLINRPPSGDVKFQFDGAIVIKTSTFAISGIASYAALKTGEPSLFLFAQLGMALGGPPAFYVTGLMAGGGFNRTLRIPALDEVETFPLLALGDTGGSAKPAEVLRALDEKKWIEPKLGAWWLAAGVRFTSFKIADTKAMVVVEQSSGLTIALLGLTKVRLPLPDENTPAYAYAELQLRVALEPDAGQFMASAVLSHSSYVLTPDAHLTGGFAFAVWFGKHASAGDFVVTLGGYHQAFSPPPHYPRVPRLGFTWAVSDAVTIKGDAYFALTPSCVMGGGGLEVQFHSGDLSAWFIAHADLLMAWRPFFFKASLAVTIGASYRLSFAGCQKTITASIGARVDMWGPPTGGTASVQLVVVSFTVDFGEKPAAIADARLDWTGFKSLLPPSNAICTVAPQSDIAGDDASAVSTSGKRWLVRPRGFTFATESAIPASVLDRAKDRAPTSPASPAIAIRPMDLHAAVSVHRVSIEKKSASGSYVSIEPAKWTFDERKRTVPGALWGTPPTPFTAIPGAPSRETIEGTLAGFTIAIPEPSLGPRVGPIVAEALFEEYVAPDGHTGLSRNEAATKAYVPSPSTATIRQISGTSTGAALAGRRAVRDALVASGVLPASTPNDPLHRMAHGAAHLFTAAPMAQG